MNKDNPTPEIQDEHQVFETPEEQILKRPGMWIGSTKSTVRQISVIEENSITEKELEIIPAVAKLAEELIVNSSDEHIRTKDKSLRGWTLDKINIQFTADGKLIVKDNGGITTKLHSSGIYPVEVIFGKLFSSSNYNDNVKRETVGTNGVGSSLTNLFSKKFKVISCDGKQKIEVTWTDNKSKKSEPKVTKSKDHYTIIEADLDLERFDIESIPYGIMKYTERLAMVLAASNPGLQVTFNDEVFKFKSFLDYVNMYGYDNVIGESNADWEVYLAPSAGNPKRFAIINGAECNDGSHIKHIDGIVRIRLEKLLAKLKLDTVTTQMIKNEYTVFINMKVDKPEYSSQAKTELTNDMWSMQNGEKVWVNISNKFTKQIQEGFILQGLKAAHEERMKQNQSQAVNKRAGELKKKSSKTIKKLIDAGEKSSSKRKKECELWIFEGASAGSGFRSNRDPRTQGCYLLKGKCTNSYNMKLLQVLLNQEFSDIIVALGLDPKNPGDLSKLRFDKVIIATDADVDGFSIFGQVFTLFAVHFPEMIAQGRIYRAISPLYKASKGPKKEYFYREETFRKFISGKSGWKTSYFKGLGSLQKEDYRIMLFNSLLERHYIGDECMNTIDAFMGANSAPRKRLLEAEV